jgi:hypothetical protein
MECMIRGRTLEVNTGNHVFLTEKCGISRMSLEFSEGTLSPGLIFFFAPGTAFNIADVAEFSGFNGDGHLHQEGEDE